MKSIPLVFHPIYSQLDLPKNHRFPIEKYQSLKDASYQLFTDKLSLHTVGQPVTSEFLQLVHDDRYIEAFISGEISAQQMKRIGFPWSEQFVKRTRTAVAGTVKTAELAAQHTIAINLTGGYHHAFPDCGSGFCVFNDLTLSALHLIEQQLASRVLIFDCDVHQGDGTAVCAAEHSHIFSLSIHCEKNFPTRKQQSDWDIGLDKGLADAEYLAQVQDALNTAIEAFKPDFIIYDAGVDIHKNDDLGLLNISTQGVYQRDKTVFLAAKRLGIPVMAVIGGGYQRDINALTQVHLQLVKAAIEVFLD